MEVTIVSDEETRSKVDELLATINFDSDAAHLGATDWMSQFTDAVTFPEFEGPVEFFICLLAYLLALPFKLIFALPPPPRFANGWACFVASLTLIGGLTALIGDLANHVGCCFGLSASTTAITFVALGTSLPDTFASMSAATMEPYADASIGNVTGSNSVNVFLGLGLPWMIAAFYWRFVGSADAWHARYESEEWYVPEMEVGFAVPAGTLGFSVAVFSTAAVVTLGTLMLRRACEGHELGGNPFNKMMTATFFVLLWLGYIAANILAE